jgi:hypothetical protein
MIVDEYSGKLVVEDDGSEIQFLCGVILFVKEHDGGIDVD